MTLNFTLTLTKCNLQSKICRVICAKPFTTTTLAFWDSQYLLVRIETPWQKPQIAWKSSIYLIFFLPLAWERKFADAHGECLNNNNNKSCNENCLKELKHEPSYDREKVQNVIEESAATSNSNGKLSELEHPWAVVCIATGGDDPSRYFILEHIPCLLHLAPAASQPHRNA